MSRRYKKKYQQYNDEPTPREQRFRDQILSELEPIIPYSVGLAMHEYKCVEAGSIGHPPQCWFVPGEIYLVRKDRYRADFVEINGPLKNIRSGNTFELSGWKSVPLENCKKFLRKK